MNAKRLKEPRTTRTDVRPTNPFGDLPADDDPPNVLPFAIAKSSVAGYRNRLAARCPECIYCGEQFPPEELTAEHAIPVSCGGQHAPWNLWLSCSNCNGERSSKRLDEWIAELQRTATQKLQKAEQVLIAGRRMGLLPDDPFERWCDTGTTG